MQENAIVSVIIPIYKVEKYIRKCIESIINQTYKNLEIILVDDGSPDDCGKICDEYALLDKRIIVIHKKNEGVSNARNFGISCSKGEFIYFIDGDDYAEPQAIEMLLMYAKREMADIVIADTNVVNEYGESIGKDKNQKYELKKFSANEAANYFMTLDWGPWNKLYKRAIHIDVKFPENKIHEDEAIMLQLLAKCKSVVYVSDRLYNYVKREGSTTSSKYGIKKMDWFEAWINNVEFSKKYFPDCVDKAVAKMTIVAIYNLSNLIRMKNEKETTYVLAELKKRKNAIFFNKEIPVVYKLRVWVALFDLTIYEKIYI